MFKAEIKVTGKTLFLLSSHSFHDLRHSIQGKNYSHHLACQSETSLELIIIGLFGFLWLEDMVITHQGYLIPSIHWNQLRILTFSFNKEMVIFVNCAFL